MQLISILLSILSSPLHAINYSNRVINYIYEHNHNNNYTYTLELNKFAIDDYQDYNDTNTQYQLLNGSSNHTTFIIDDDNGDDVDFPYILSLIEDQCFFNYFRLD